MSWQIWWNARPENKIYTDDGLKARLKLHFEKKRVTIVNGTLQMEVWVTTVREREIIILNDCMVCPLILSFDKIDGIEIGPWNGPVLFVRHF